MALLNAEASTGSAGFLPARVVHLHPTRQCNLACVHCYSQSGPQHREAIDPHAVIRHLDALYAHGYRVLSVSGGEPLLYGGLDAVVRAAAAAGFQVTMITNGAAVTPSTVERLQPLVHLMAVSMDGAPDTHNRVRAHPRAFAWAEHGLRTLRAGGVPSGVAYGVSAQSLPHLPWAHDFAVDVGAGLLQLHPFAAVGRGLERAEVMALGRGDRARTFVLAELLGAHSPLRVQCDLAPGRALATHDTAYRALLDGSGQSLSDMINPLVITDDGTMLPWSFNTNRSLALGTLDGDPAAWWHAAQRGGHHLRAVVRRALATASTRADEFLDWFALVVSASHGCDGQADGERARTPPD